MGDQEHGDGGEARITVVTLPGTVEYRNAECVQDDLAAALEPGVTAVIVDMTGTVLCDSAGLGKLVFAQRRAAANGTSLLIVMPPASPLNRVFALVGFDRVLTICPSLGAALVAARAGRAIHDSGAGRRARPAALG